MKTEQLKLLGNIIEFPKNKEFKNIGITVDINPLSFN